MREVIGITSLSSLRTVPRPVGIGTWAEYLLSYLVAGLHRASPSTSLDKSVWDIQFGVEFIIALIALSRAGDCRARAGNLELGVGIQDSGVGAGAAIAELELRLKPVGAGLRLVPLPLPDFAHGSDSWVMIKFEKEES